MKKRAHHHQAVSFFFCSILTHSFIYLFYFTNQFHSESSIYSPISAFGCQDRRSVGLWGIDYSHPHAILKMKFVVIISKPILAATTTTTTTTIHLFSYVRCLISLIFLFAFQWKIFRKTRIKEIFLKKVLFENFKITKTFLLLCFQPIFKFIYIEIQHQHQHSIHHELSK